MSLVRICDVEGYVNLDGEERVAWRMERGGHLYVMSQRELADFIAALMAASEEATTEKLARKAELPGRAGYEVVP